MIPNNLIAQLIRSLMLSEISYVKRITDRRAVWIPQSKPQWLAVLSRADILFYGGAAGGGKTDLALGLAIECHQKSVIFRREYPQFDDAIDRGNEILAPLQVTFNSQRKRWQLPDRRVVKIGAVEHKKDLSKWRGRPHDLIVFDEVPEFPEDFVRFLMGWRRTAFEHKQRSRVLMCGNPPTTPEGQWIVDYFAPWLDEDHPNPAQPGELRYFARIDDKDQEVESGDPFEYKGETIRPLSRTFIPAKLEDNPFYGAEYEAQLQDLPEPLRSQLRWGLFNSKPIDNPWQLIPSSWIDEAVKRGKEGKRPDLAVRACGLDVARGGADNTVLARLYGEWFELDMLSGKLSPDGPTAATWAIEKTGDLNAPYFVDVIGVGGSAHDTLAAVGNSYPINVANRSEMRDKTERFRMVNIRAAMYWLLREALNPKSDHAIALPDDRELKTELRAIRYKVTTQGILIEPKDDIKKRISRSPDKADAIALAWYGANVALDFILFET